jgi:hypothetical protein
VADCNPLTPNSISENAAKNKVYGRQQRPLVSENAAKKDVTLPWIRRFPDSHVTLCMGQSFRRQIGEQYNEDKLCEWVYVNSRCNTYMTDTIHTSLCIFLTRPLRSDLGTEKCVLKMWSTSVAERWMAHIAKTTRLYCPSLSRSFIFRF